MNKFVNQIVRRAKNFVQVFTGGTLEVDCDNYEVLYKVICVIGPLLTAILLYQSLKYHLITTAYQYEKFVRKRCGHMRRLSKQLKLLVKHYGNFYFRFMPMNHGRTMPQTYTLFTAIKEVLVNSNRPGTRCFRLNLLVDLIRGNSQYSPQHLSNLEVNLRNYYNESLNEIDPLSEYNLDIMKCSRELIIQGVKDFDVMSTIFRVLETVLED
ncbi:hypothetical protein RUM44_006489 [Polyplax serrata]|uniref:Uncharacterized protein n=1 Tax=Polyplax serrata TaxID=468196 RepID=A0ABR1AI97_POLSC